MELAVGLKGKLFGGLAEGHVESSMEFERTAKLGSIKSQSIDMSELDLVEEALVGFGTQRKPGFLLLDEFQVL